MFQFRRFPAYTYFIQCTLLRYCLRGFPHSDISGSSLICSSPKLFAACHVLHRLLMPRHSPCALFSLTYSFWSLNLEILVLELCRFNKSLFFTKLYLPYFLKFHNLLFFDDSLESSLCCLALFFSLFSFQGANQGLEPLLRVPWKLNNVKGKGLT